MNTQDELNDLKARIAELEKSLAKKDGLWRPEKGKGYWRVSHYADLVEGIYSADTCDRGAISIGNCFPTREAAERHKQRLIVTQKLRELAGGWVPDWKNGKQDKFYFYLYTGTGMETWKVRAHWGIYLPNTIYFQNREQAQSAIDTLGDNLNVLLPEGI